MTSRSKYKSPFLIVFKAVVLCFSRKLSVWGQQNVPLELPKIGVRCFLPGKVH